VARFDGQRVALGAALAAPPRARIQRAAGRRRGEAPREDLKAWRDALLRGGYGRILDGGGRVVDLAGLDEERLASLARAARAGRERAGPLLLVDRIAIRREEARARVVEAVAGALPPGQGR